MHVCDCRCPNDGITSSPLKTIRTSSRGGAVSLLGRSNSFPKTIKGENKRETTTQVDQVQFFFSSFFSSEALRLSNYDNDPSSLSLDFFTVKKGDIPQEPWRAFAFFPLFSLLPVFLLTDEDDNF